MFYVKVEQVDLAQALKRVEGTIGKSTKVGDKPYDHLHMKTEIDSEGELKLIISSFNGYDATRVVVDVFEGAVGTAPLINFTTFSKFVSKISSKETIELKDNNKEGVQIIEGKKKTPTTIQGMCNTNLVIPDLSSYTFDDTVSVILENLLEGVSVCKDMIQETESTPLYNCINLTVNGTSLKFEAIDHVYMRIMAHKIKSASSAQNDIKITVNCNRIYKVLSLISESNKQIELCANDQVLVIRAECHTMLLAKTHGVFPDTTGYFPTTKELETVVSYDRNTLLELLKKVEVLADADKSNVVKHVNVDISEDGISELSVVNKGGSIKEPIIGKAIDNNVAAKKTINLDCIIKTLQALDFDSITWRCSGTKSYLYYQDGTSIFKCMIPYLRNIDLQAKPEKEKKTKTKPKSDTKKKGKVKEEEDYEEEEDMEEAS